MAEYLIFDNTYFKHSTVCFGVGVLGEGGLLWLCDCLGTPSLLHVPRTCEGVTVLSERSLADVRAEVQS